MFKFSAQNYGPDFVLLNYNHQMGPFGPSPMLGLGETFDLLKILFLLPAKQRQLAKEHCFFICKQKQVLEAQFFGSS